MTQCQRTIWNSRLTNTISGSNPTQLWQTLNQTQITFVQLSTSLLLFQFLSTQSVFSCFSQFLPSQK
jgi:hypothetical protein